MSDTNGHKKRKYTDREKAMFLLALEANAGNLSATERETGVPLETLRDWRNGLAVNADIANIRNETRGNLADEFEALTWQALKLAKDKAIEATYQQLVTGAAIGADKQQLLRGKATQIVDEPARADAMIERICEKLKVDRAEVEQIVLAQPEFRELGKIG